MADIHLKDMRIDTDRTCACGVEPHPEMMVTVDEIQKVTCLRCIHMAAYGFGWPRRASAWANHVIQMRTLEGRTCCGDPDD